MIVINTVDSQKFTFNGIEYYKNFTPVVRGNKIEVINTYDARLRLTAFPTDFSEFTVNGNTFASVTLLQTALLPVLFTRDSLGGGGATAFTLLTDTPSSYVGQAGKIVKVNGGETALQFDVSADGFNLFNLQAKSASLPATVNNREVAIEIDGGNVRKLKFAAAYRENLNFFSAQFATYPIIVKIWNLTTNEAVFTNVIEFTLDTDQYILTLDTLIPDTFGTVNDDLLLEFELVSSGGSINQDNIYKIISTVSETTGTIPFAAALNALPQWTIGETEIAAVSIFAPDEVNSAYNTLYDVALIGLGKGVYGVGGTEILPSNILIRGRRPFVYDIDNPSNQLIELGDVGSNDIVTAFNAHTFTGDENPVQDQGEGFVRVTVTIDSVPLEYLFIGEGGEYGVGGSLTAVLADFILLTGAVETPVLSVTGVFPDENGNVALKDAMCFFLETPEDKTYTLALEMPYAGTIPSTVTESLSGTCTATFKINGVALGGTANAVSETKQSQAHASDNAFVEGDTVEVEITANADCLDMALTAKIIRA